jgi:hypothetical protein
MTLPAPDDGMAVIAARFAFGAGAAAGEGAEGGAMDAAGLPRRRALRPFQEFNLPPAVLTTTTVGSYLDLPGQFQPPTGWLWDITMLSVSGFTAGAVAVSLNAPLVTPAGAPCAIEPVASFNQAGILPFPRKGHPLLDSTQRLVWCVTAALTGVAQISGMVIAVPAERLSEYLE